METWVRVWRSGIAPQLSTPGLEALRKALVEDDSRLIQGATTTPPPLAGVQVWTCKAACGIAFPFMVEGATVGEVEIAFARACFECDQAIGEPAGCRWFLNWFDETPREEMRQKLLPEVERVLAERYAAEDDRESIAEGDYHYYTRGARDA